MSDEIKKEELEQQEVVDQSTTEAPAEATEPVTEDAAKEEVVQPEVAEEPKEAPAIEEEPKE